MQEFYEGLADILEVSVAEITPTLDLSGHAWDSLAVVSTIALCDDCFNIMLNGQDLVKCQTVADIEALIAAKRGA
jgi:acyl carrier protein